MNYRLARKQVGLSLAQLGKVLGVDPEMLRQYEAGALPWPGDLEGRYLQLCITVGDVALEKLQSLP